MSASFSPPSHETSQLLVFHLQHSISPSATEREAALSWLQACQATPGFQYCLVEVVAARGLASEVRIQAALYFKNCLDKYWKNVGRIALDPENKHLIRQKLLTLLDEEDSAIAKTLAFCVGRIARKDYPKDWPDLFDKVLEAMQQSFQSIESGHPQARLVLHRALLNFQQAVKALSENRTLAGKNIMGRLCEQAFPILSQLYHAIFQHAISSMASNDNGLPAPAVAGQPIDLELSLLTFKILAKLVVYGWGGIGDDVQRKQQFIEVQTQFFVSSIQDFTTIYQARQAIISNPANITSLQNQAQSMVSPLSFLNKHTLAYGKMYQALLFQNHIIFHGLGQTRVLVQLYWSLIQQASQGIRLADLDDPASPFPLKFVMQFLLFIKYSFSQFPYKDTTLRSEDFATQLVDCIILHLLPLRQADLNKWQADPEEFIKDEDEEKWKFDVRPCAEALLKELMKEYEHTVYQINEYRLRYQNATTFEDLLVKEAVYAALSHSANEFQQAKDRNGQSLIDYRSFLGEHLLLEGFSSDASGIILRRRIAAIASAWIADNPNYELQTQTYRLLVHLLQKNEATDLAVRMTAAKALGNCDAWELEVQPLLPFLETALVQLADLVQEVDLPESKMQINEILGNLIVRVDRHITPHLERLMGIIMQLWSSAQDDPSKQAVVATFKKLVDALGTGSPVLHSAIRQLVQESCDPSSPSHVLLQDDGLELWRSALRFAQAPTEDLLALAPLSIQLLSQGSDILKKVLRIIQSYIVLQPMPYLVEHTNTIFSAVTGLFLSLNSEATKPLLYTVDMIIQSIPSSIWAQALLESGLFLHMVKTIVTDPTAPSVTRFLPTLSRLAISDGTAFDQLLRRSAEQLGASYDQVAQAILQKWLDRYDNLTYPAQRKLVALGLATFVQTTNPLVLDKIDEIIGAWLSALGETPESARGEYVSAYLDTQGAQPGTDLWQQQQDTVHLQYNKNLGTQPLSRTSTNSGYMPVVYQTGNPTFLKASLANPNLSFYSGASSSGSSLQTASTSQPASPPSEQWRRESSIYPLSMPGGHLALAEKSATYTDTLPTTSPSLPEHYHFNNNVTPSMTSLSKFSNPLFVDYDPNVTYSTHAGRDDDDDSTGYEKHNTVCNSADSYYNDDEHDEEANLTTGWGGDGDGWGNQTEEAPIPENERLKALAARDLLHTLKLTDVISAALNHTAELNGGMQAFHANYLAPPKVAPVVLEEFQEWLSGIARPGD